MITLPILFTLIETIFFFTWLADKSEVCQKILADLGQREPQIDGLRGLAALSVALHHLSYVIFYFSTGTWSIPDDYIGIWGKLAVSVFFLICAYLFWGRLVTKLDTFQKVRAFSWLGFAQNRIGRLVPMYVVAMSLAIFFLGFVDQGFSLHFTRTQLLWQTFLSYTFNFFGSPQYNGSFLASTAISVSWSLYFEWFFYLTLPFLALTRMRYVWFWTLPSLYGLNEILFHVPWIDYFILGALCAELSRFTSIRNIMARWPFGIASVALLVWVCMTQDYEGIVHGLGPVLIALAFFPIACGNSWLGLLTCRGARLLGAVSYSIYLLNIIVESQIVPYYPAKILVMPMNLIFWMPPTIFLLVLISMFTYLFIERPFMKKHVIAQQPSLIKS